MSARPVIVSAVQITAIDGEKAATIEKMLGLIDIAGQLGSKLIVLPELWTGLGFSNECTVPGSLDTRLHYAAGLRLVSRCAARASSGLR
jgi:predicted amidohydrolase